MTVCRAVPTSFTDNSLPRGSLFISSSGFWRYLFKTLPFNLLNHLSLLPAFGVDTSKRDVIEPYTANPFEYRVMFIM
jgi:hypothetical protein